MKITVINGNNRHGSTWHCMDLFKQELARYGENEVTEFFLPKDMEYFCMGCYSCFNKGEQTCPHVEKISPFVAALEDADLIIITSSVYAFDITGQLKALLDHLCFMWLSHRPNPKMFHKVGLIITSTAGAGLSHTAKTIKNSLSFWGVKKIYSYNKVVAAAKWEDISDKKKEKITQEIAKKAKMISKTVNKIDNISYPFFRKFIFHIMKAMMKSNTWNLRDRNHWESQGWLNKTKPY